MKRKGYSLLAYGEQRDRELYDTYRRELTNHTREDGTIDNMAAVKAAVLKPCSRFWISEEVAATNMRRFMENPSLLEEMIPTKKAMYKELMEVYARLRADPKNQDLTDRQVAYLASDMPASQFYMTPGSAMVRICHERKRRSDMNVKRLTAKKVMESARKAAGTKENERLLKSAAVRERAASKVSEPAEANKDVLRLPHWSGKIFKPRPLSWHIKKRVRTAIQYVIHFDV